jgi:alpha-L-fucosidase
MGRVNVKPHKKQLEFLDWEFGVFFHFGIRTFYEGHKDWDMKIMKEDAFNPKELDCRQWIMKIKEAGAKYAILVAKHHDGFANWPSKYTSYSVANTPWRDGKGDVVADFVSACREFNIKVGIYYSPAEFSMKEEKKSAKEYDDYFINQIGELLTEYGEIDYLWFDGCGSEGHEYDKLRIVNEIRRMQPNILIFNMWDPDTRWVGNEAGIAPSPCQNLVKALDFSIQTENKDKLENEIFLPVECDFRIRRDNWFYSDKDEDTIKSLDELIGLYYYSVGRGANFLINIAPDRRGLLPEKDTNRIIEFGNEIKRRFSNPLAIKNDFIKTDNTYICKFDKPTLINHVVIKEKLTEGEAVKEYKILISPYSHGKSIIIYRGQNIGHKAICCFPTISTTELKIEIAEYTNEYEIDDIEVFYSECF